MKLDVSMKSLRRGTNILEVEVPKELDAHVPTGIGFFDAVLGGEGFTPSVVGLFTGEPGAGKTTLCLALADALTRAGHACLFNTGEESLVQVRKTVRRIGLANGFVCGQDRLVGDLVRHARWLQEREPGKQVVLVHDSLATLDDGKYANGHTNSCTPVRALQAIANWAKQKSPGGTYGVALIVGHVTKANQFAGKQTLKHMVDLHLHLSIDDEDGSPTRGLRLFRATKNRFGCAGIAHALRMTERGLEDEGRVME